MNLYEELRRFSYKELPDEESISNQNFLNSDLEKTENSLKMEIRKSNLIVQKKIDDLKGEIENLNLQNDNLEKELFRFNRKIKNTRKCLFDILDVYCSLTTSLTDKEDVKIAELMQKKAASYLAKLGIEETAKLGIPFNYRYHEAINENELEKGKEYVIKQIIAQGYIQEGETIKIAKVIVTENNNERR